ncbi:MAG: HAD hydrolase-like protein [Pseudomonadota bacterium]
MVKAVLFGSLSSLTDLVDLERRAFNQTFRDVGLDLHWSKTEYDQLLLSKGRFSGQVEALQGRVPSTFYQGMELNFRSLIDSETLELRPWAKSALDWLATRPTKTALVSGAERQTVLRVLAALFGHRASTMFNVVTAQDVAPDPKPAPALYAAALSQLRVDPGDAFAIEATHHGILAAQAAGLRTAGATGGFDAIERLDEADIGLGKDMRETIFRLHAQNLKGPIPSDPLNTAESLAIRP